MVSEGTEATAGTTTSQPMAVEYGPKTAEAIVLGILQEPEAGTDNRLVIDLNASTTAGNTHELDVPVRRDAILTVTVADSFGVRTLSSSEVLAVQSATTGLAPASPSSTTMVAVQLRTTSMILGTPTGEVTSEKIAKTKKGSKKKSKKDKHRDRPPTLSTMVGRRSSPGKSAKSPRKKKSGLQLAACARSLSMSQITTEEEESKNTKKRQLSEVACSSDDGDNASTDQGEHQTPLQDVRAMHADTGRERQYPKCFQDHQPQNEVFNVDESMMAEEML